MNNPELFQELKNLMKDTIEEVKKLEGDIARANQVVLSRLNTFASFIAHQDALSFSYISGMASRAPDLINREAEQLEIHCSAAEMLKSRADFVVVAPAGFGKSSFCNRNALLDLQLLRDQQSQIVPILVKLHLLAGRHLDDFRAAFFNSSELQHLWESRNEKNRNRVFRFYLDGLDEIPNETAQSKILLLCSALKEAAPESQIIITCRDHVAGEHLRRFYRISLAEMNDERCREFVDRWLAHDPEKVNTFKNQVESIPALTQLMRVPLLATLVLSVFSSTGTIPESRIRIYDMFVSLLAGGWDIAKSVQRGSQYGPQTKVTILQALAWKLQLAGRRDASIFEFSEAVKSQLPAMANQSGAILAEIIHDGLLIQVGTGLAFSHLSFQEYLAAKNLLEPTGRKVTTAISDFLRGQIWWRDVLGFYVSMSSQPHEVEVFIRDHVKRIAARNFDPQIIPRARHLLMELASAFPGAVPSLEFPELAKVLNPQQKIG